MHTNNQSIARVFAAGILSACLFSCTNENIVSQDDTENEVEVNVSFREFSYSFEEDGDLTTRASDKTPSEAGMNRISFSVFDTENQLVYSTTKKASVDVDNFDNISCMLLPGDYQFVAVVHNANADTEEAAAIASPTQATLTTSKVHYVFTANQLVTIEADKPKNVTIDLGKRVTSQFRLVCTDETPSNVEYCEVILNPASDATTTFTFNPTTGFSDETYRYSIEFYSSVGFTKKPVNASGFITQNPQNISVTVNMKDASKNIVRTRTFTDVPMAPHRITSLTGSFFHSSAESSFIIDTTDDAMYTITF